MMALALIALLSAEIAQASPAPAPTPGNPFAHDSRPPGQSTFPTTGGSTRADTSHSLEVMSRFMNGRTLFLEKNYLGWNAPAVGPTGDRGNTPLLIEAWIAPHLSLFDGLYNLDRPRDEVTSTFQHHFALFITPEFRLRMIKNGGEGIYSSPVRPISFNPRIEAFEYLLWRRDWGGPWNLINDGPVHDQAGGVFVVAPRLTIFGHHSNGQEHCRFGAETGLDGTPDPTCTTPVPGAPMTTVNFRSGDFSTDYFGGGANAAYYTLDNGGFEHRKVAAGLLYRYNPVWSWLPGSMDDGEAALFGQHSVHADLEFQDFIHGYYDVAAGSSTPNLSGRLAPSVDSWLNGKLRVTANLSYFFGTGAGVPSTLASIEASYALFRLGGAGLFLRYSHGRDYLNILYVEPAINTLQFGLIFDQEPLFEYHGAPPA